MSEFKPNKTVHKCYCDKISQTHPTNFINAQIIATRVKLCCIESLIVKRGYDVNRIYQTETTFMHELMSPDQLMLALKHGGDINALNRDGVTVLSDSIRLDEDNEDKVICHAKTIMLLEAGADIMIVDSSGFTVFDYIKDEIKMQRKRTRNGCFCFIGVFPGDIDIKCNVCATLQELEKSLQILKNHRKKIKTFFQKMMKKCDINPKKQKN